MKCPNCGKEIEEGHLICEACGSEIQIVPDFEPEIENSITETLSTLAALQDEDDTTEEAQDVEESKEEKSEKEKSEKKENGKKKNVDKSRKIGTMAAIAVMLFVLIIFYQLYSDHVRSVSYQIDKAQTYASRGEYEKAITCLDTAYERDNTQPQILFLKADYFYLMSDNESAVQVLKQIIDKGSYSYEDVEDAYDKIIAIYTSEERYEDINELLLTCEETTIVNRFQSYLAKEPEFSYAEGYYEKVIPLKLSSNTSGTIYYTMDGSTPDEQSQIYTAPLFLESGEYVISAVFVNDHGIKSDVVTKIYQVGLEAPNAPEVELYSGEYTQPMMIAVEEQEDCSIFYTTDDSEPNGDSVPYTGPIPMPLGTTNFKFISISREGISSEVTMRTYTLALDGTISTNEAVVKLVARLVETGYLLDTSGRTEQLSNTYSYQFSSVLRIGEDNYFTINEYFDDGTGILNRTDKVFLVQVYTGAAARLGYNEKGEFVAVPI